MRAGRVIGVSLAVMALAAAVVAWAPAVWAQQEKVPAQPSRQTVVTVQTDGNSAPQMWRMEDPSAMTLLQGGPRLGVEIRDVEPAEVTKLKLAGQAGVVVAAVTKDSAAAKAGLKEGDCIVQFDGEAVRSAQHLTRLVTETSPGKTVKVGVIREGKRLDVEATLVKADDTRVEVRVNQGELRRQIEGQLAEVQPLIRQFRMQRQPGVPGMPGENAFSFQGSPFVMGAAGRGRLGVTLQELTSELAAYFNVKDGVLVSAVRADSPAAKAGIKAGDCITAVNDKPIANAGDLTAQLSDKSGEVSIGLTRDKKPMTLKATLDKASETRPRRTIKGIGA